MTLFLKTIKLLPLVFLLILPIHAHAQKSTLDSLVDQHSRLDSDEKAANAIKIAKYSIDRESALAYSKEAVTLAETDTTKVLALNQLGWEYKNMKYFDSAAHKLKEAESIALKEDYQVGLADIYLTYGSIYTNQSLYDSALLFQEKALAIQLELGDQEGIAALYNNMSVSYQEKGDYDEGRVVLEKSREIWESLGRKKEVGDSYLNIGTFYYYQGKLDSCIAAFTLALTTYEEEELPNFQAYALVNLGIVYMEELNETEKAQKYFEEILEIEESLNSKNFVGIALGALGGIAHKQQDYEAAIAYFNRALVIHEENQSLYNISLIQTNLGSVYNDLEEYQKAKSILEESMSIKRKIGDKDGLMGILDILSTTEQKLGNSKAAADMLEEAYQLSVETGNKLKQRDIVYSRIKQYEDTKAYAKAVALFDEFISLKDTILNRDKVGAIEDVTAKYETEKKEQEIVYLSQENQLKEASLQRNAFFIVALVVVLILLVLVFYFVRYKAKQKHKAVLREQKIRMRERQMAAVIESQEAERKRFAIDLHDGMGQLFAALQMNIQSLRETDANLEKRHEYFDNASKLLKEVHQEIRNVAFNLMPQTLVKEGLAKGLEELTKKINQTGELEVHYSSVDVPKDLSEIVQVSLYRITQELMSNIMKHNNAQNVYLGLTGHEGELVLSIEDDGVGYDLEVFKSSEGNGWRNINTRLSLIKASIDFDMSLGKKGSSILVNVNLLEPILA